jgi:hypothetical protein
MTQPVTPTASVAEAEIPVMSTPESGTVNVPTLGAV